MITGFFKSAYSDILDFIYPRVCIVTSEKLPESNSNIWISDKVIESLPRALPETSELVRQRSNADRAYTHFEFRYDSQLQEIIHGIKYSGFSGLAEHLGTVIGNQLNEVIPFAEKYDAIIPVPLHKTRMRERGYNQSECIARGIDKYLECGLITDAVERNRKTTSQTKLSRSERQENITNAFSVTKPEVLKNKNVIIADDVATTCATLYEMVKVLKNAGCNRVMVCTIAAAVDEYEPK